MFPPKGRSVGEQPSDEPPTAAPLRFSLDAEDTIASKPVGPFASRSAAALYLWVRFGFRWFFVFPREHLVTAAGETLETLRLLVPVRTRS